VRDVVRKRLLQRVDMVREGTHAHTHTHTHTPAHALARTHTHPHNAQVSFSPTSSASEDAQQCRMRFSWKSEHKIPEPVAEEMGILEGVRQKQRMSFSYKMVFFLKKLRVIKGRAPKYHMLFSYKIIGVRACVRAFVLACMCVCVCVYVCV